MLWVVRAIFLTVLLIFVGFLGLQLVQLVQFGDSVEGDALSALLADRTFYGNYVSDGEPADPWVEYYAADGRLSYREGDEQSFGRWHVRDDMVCFQYDDEPGAGEYCFAVYRSESEIRLAVPVFFGLAQTKHVIGRYEVGNPENLPMSAPGTS